LMGPTPLLKMVFSYGFRPRLRLLSILARSGIGSLGSIVLRMLHCNFRRTLPLRIRHFWYRICFRVYTHKDQSGAKNHWTNPNTSNTIKKMNTLNPNTFKSGTGSSVNLKTFCRFYGLRVLISYIY